MSLEELLYSFQSFNVLLMLFEFIYVYWCSTRFPYHVMLVSFVTRRVSLVEQELLTIQDRMCSFLLFVEYVLLTLVFSVVFRKLLFVHLSCFFWSLQ
jgi:hypothetical protein